MLGGRLPFRRPPPAGLDWYPRAQPKDHRKFPTYPWQGMGLEVGQGGSTLRH